MSQKALHICFASRGYYRRQGDVVFVYKCCRCESHYETRSGELENSMYCVKCAAHRKKMRELEEVSEFFDL